MASLLRACCCGTSGCPCDAEFIRVVLADVDVYAGTVGFASDPQADECLDWESVVNSGDINGTYHLVRVSSGVWCTYTTNLVTTMQGIGGAGTICATDFYKITVRCLSASRISVTVEAVWALCNHLTHTRIGSAFYGEAENVSVCSSDTEVDNDNNYTLLPGGVPADDADVVYTGVSGTATVTMAGTSGGPCVDPYARCRTDCPDCDDVKTAVVSGFGAAPDGTYVLTRVPGRCRWEGAGAQSLVCVPGNTPTGGAAWWLTIDGQDFVALTDGPCPTTGLYFTCSLGSAGFGTATVS